MQANFEQFSRLFVTRMGQQQNEKVTENQIKTVVHAFSNAKNESINVDQLQANFKERIKGLVHAFNPAHTRQDKRTYFLTPLVGAIANKIFTQVDLTIKLQENKLSEKQIEAIFDALNASKENSENFEQFEKNFNQEIDKLSGSNNSEESETASIISSAKGEVVKDLFKIKLSSFWSEHLEKSLPEKSLSNEMPLSEKMKTVKTQLEKEIKALKKEINYLEKNGSETQKKKVPLFKQGLELLKESGKIDTFKTCSLVNSKRFILANDQAPHYFRKTIFIKTFEVEHTSDFFEYENSDDNTEDYFVDFANKKLGGGAFGEGFVQEEIIVVEFPRFAAHMAANLDPKDKVHCAIKIRVGRTNDSDQVLQGSPTPYVMKGVQRLQKMTCRSAYGRGIRNISKEDLLKQTIPNPSSNRVNILAISAAKLHSPEVRLQTHITTIKDLFNTAVAGFQLAKDQTESDKKCKIHSGKLGCGVFYNHPLIGMLTQLLAAQYVGVDLKMYGYMRDEVELAEKVWSKIQQELQGEVQIEQCLEAISKFSAEALQQIT